jgi:hypothetical protein
MSLHPADQYLLLWTNVCSNSEKRRWFSFLNGFIWTLVPLITIHHGRALFIASRFEVAFENFIELGLDL